MRVTCPECESKFKVPDKALGETGRKLRCGQCGHQWFQEPVRKAAEPQAKAKAKPKAKTEPAEDPDDTFAEAPGDDGEDREDGFAADLRAHRDDDDLDPPPLGGMSRFRGRRASERPRRQLPIPLLVLAAAAVAIPVILLAARGALVEAWPASALLYDSVGLHVPVPGEGLVLQNVYVQRQQEGSVPLLVVAGEIRNPTDRFRSLPALRGTVLDEQGNALQSWLFAAETPQLLPGDTGRFQSELAAPPGSASRVNVTFTNERPEQGLGY